MVATLFSVFIILMLIGVPIAFAIGLATFVPMLSGYACAVPAISR